MKKRVIAATVVMSFLLSGCSVKEEIKMSLYENIGRPILEKIVDILSREESVTVEQATEVVEEVVDTVAKTESEEQADFLFPTDTTLITEEVLDSHTREEVAIIRNEIYARHGYIFKTEPFITYFNEKSWYKKNESFHEGMLNDIERKNREIIVSYEQKRGWR